MPKKNVNLVRSKPEDRLRAGRRALLRAGRPGRRRGRRGYPRPGAAFAADG